MKRTYYETLEQANDRLMKELEHEVNEWGKMADEHGRFVASLGGRRQQRVRYVKE